MPSQRTENSDSHLAESLKLAPKVYIHLRDSLQSGEFPVWLRTGDPVLAGKFFDAFEFEMLCEKLHSQESLERRRHNLAVRFQEKGMQDDAEKALSAYDEGRLEDLSFSLDASAPAPASTSVPVEAPVEATADSSTEKDEATADSAEGDASEKAEAPAEAIAVKEEKPEHVEFVQKLRTKSGLATALRAAFRKSGEMTIEAVTKKEADLKPYQDLAGWSGPIQSFVPGRYLLLRRGERAHAVKVCFSLPADARKSVFEKESGFPPQEKDAYRKLFDQFVDQERLPRFIQETRARLKHMAETAALQRAWETLEFSIDRGLHGGPVLGLCSVKGKVFLSLLDENGELVNSGSVPVKGDDLAERILKFLGDVSPTLVAFPGDSPSRSACQKIIKKLRASETQARQALIPVPVIRTMMREVARRGAESLLGHDERQAFLLATLVRNPREAALHTPHVVRAFIPYRGEFNPRRLEEFETTFLRSMLATKGLNVNSAPADMLRLIPDLDADGVVAERSTADFLSVEDFQDRMGLCGPGWRATGALIRVPSGQTPFDNRPLHPVYYGLVHEVLAENNLSVSEALKNPFKLKELDWDKSLDARGWGKAVISRIVQDLQRNVRKKRRPRPKGKGIETLSVGQELKGKVASLTEYGAFVSVGLRSEGLVHVSQMSDKFVKDPAEIVKVGEAVKVRVLSVDIEKGRFRLTMKSEIEAKEEETVPS